jgi:hypothetical protein
MVSPFL